MGSTLNAVVTDANGEPDAIAYQWFAGGVPIQGATQSAYVVSASDVGKAITVQARYTDKANNSEEPISDPTAAVTSPPANNPPTGDVTISGDAEVGKTLTAANTLQDDDGLGQITYRWFADGVEVGTGDAYTLQDADKGKTITVKAEYTDGKGTAESVESTPTAAVTSPPANQAPTDIELSANQIMENQDGAVVGTLKTTDPDPSDTHTYTVSDNRFEVDAQGNLKLKAGETVEFAQAQTISLDITATDAAGASYTETFTLQVRSAPTPGNQAPSDMTLTNNKLPENQASAIVGRLLTTDPDAGDTHTYTVDDPRFEISADGTLKLRAGERVDYAQASTITLNITADDGKGGTLQKAFVLEVQDDPNYPMPPDPNSPGSVRIEGDPRAGQTLTAVLSDDNGVPTSGVAYQWYRSNQKIDGATNATYTLENKDINHKITVIAQYQDLANHPESVSAVTPYIQHAQRDNTIGTVVIRGEVQVGKTLSALITDPDGEPPASEVEYQWRVLRPGSNQFEDIPGANAQTYLIQESDLDTAFQVIAKYTDLQGTREHIGSTSTIRAIAADAVPQPLIEHGEYSLRGSFSVIPQPDAQSAWVRYTDEQNVEHFVRWRKENGVWQAEDALPEGTTLDSASGKFFVPGEYAKDLQHSFAANTINGVESTPVRFYPYVDAVGNQVPQDPIITLDNYHSDYGSFIGGLTIRPGENTEVLTLRYQDENGAEHTLTVTREQYSVRWSAEPEPSGNDGIRFNSETGSVHFDPHILADGSALTAVSHNRVSGISHTSTHTVPYDAPGKPIFEQGGATNPTLPEHGAMRVTPGTDTDRLTVTYDTDSSRDTLTIEKQGAIWQTQSALPDGITLNAQTGALTFSADVLRDYSRFNTQSANTHTPYTTGASGSSGAAVTQPNPPKLTAGSLEGSVVITPDMDGAQPTLEMVVRYTDENGQSKTLYTYSSFLYGWVFSDSSYGVALPNGTGGVYIDSQSGVLTLSPDAVRDGSAVNAQALGHSWKDYPAAAAPFTAGQDASTPPVLLSLSGVDHVNEGQQAEYTVTLNQAVAHDVRVNIRLIHEDSDQGLLTPSTQTLTLAAGETQASFSVHIADDGKTGSRPSYRVQLENPDGAALNFDHALSTRVYDTTPIPPSAPTVQNGPSAGSVIISPNWDADRLEVRYTDENQTAQHIILTKNAQGEWEGTLPAGVEKSDFYGSFALLIQSDAIQDGSTLTARNSTQGLNSADVTHQAGRDPFNSATHPHTTADEHTLAFGETIELDILANDHDPQGDNTLNPASITLYGSWESGQKLDTADGVWEVVGNKVRFTPANATPEYSPSPIRYTVEDQDGNQSEHTDIRLSYNFPPADVSLHGADTIAEGQSAEYTLRLSHRMEQNVEVTLKLTHLDTERKDLILFNETWTETLRAGNTAQNLYLRTLRDIQPENPESYRLEIVSVSANARIGSEKSVTTRIDDTSNPADASRAPEAATISASGGTITVTPQNQTLTSLTLNYTAANGDLQSHTFGKWNNQWGDWAPSGMSIDSQTGRVTIASDTLKADSDLIVITTNDHVDGRYEAQTLAHIDAQGNAQLLRQLNSPTLTLAEPELDFGKLERGTDAQDSFVIDGQGVKTLSGFNINDVEITPLAGETQNNAPSSLAGEGQGGGFNLSHGDLLQLESDAFPSLEKGTLADQAFTIGHEATSAEHRVIYNAQTGELAYDPDGNGAAVATPIARLDPNLELEAQHIQII